MPGIVLPFKSPSDSCVTSIVFGEKGAGKTAMRLQIVRHLHDYNQSHPQAGVYVIEYDDGPDATDGESV